MTNMQPSPEGEVAAGAATKTTMGVVCAEMPPPDPPVESVANVDAEEPRQNGTAEMAMDASETPTEIPPQTQSPADFTPTTTTAEVSICDRPVIGPVMPLYVHTQRQKMNEQPPNQNGPAFKTESLDTMTNGSLYEPAPSTSSSMDQGYFSQPYDAYSSASYSGVRHGYAGFGTGASPGGNQMPRKRERNHHKQIRPQIRHDEARVRILSSLSRPTHYGSTSAREMARRVIEKQEDDRIEKRKREKMHALSLGNMLAQLRNPDEGRDADGNRAVQQQEAVDGEVPRLASFDSAPRRNRFTSGPQRPGDRAKNSATETRPRATNDGKNDAAGSDSRFTQWTGAFTTQSNAQSGAIVDTGVVPPPAELGADDVPPPPPHPTDPIEVRKVMRSKMHRCVRCRTRFVERGLYERHLQQCHPDDYAIYMALQEEEMEQQRREEMEQNRLEELTTGGFIPPQSQVAADGYDVDLKDIPLPGEGFGGVAPRFDRYGGLRMPRRPYRKKVSPQCPFCDKRFRNEHSLRKHIGKKHSKMINYIQCNACYKCLRNADDLHTHACELKFICFECVPIRNLCTEQRLRAHRAKFHRGANSGFRCADCNRKFLTPRKLRKHRKMAHVTARPYKCHFCEDYFPTETQTALHERIHTGKLCYECAVCDFRTNRFAKLDRHRRLEHGYICPICTEKMTEWAELKHHTLDSHGGYLTDETGARFVESPRVWILFLGE